ncbi:aspartic proteinase nepenthesin-2-like [Papaver somniferum]|uniref:aspartic proteinase nepenthesin-2-like n=1 Tax=Papaver somniferum TaxID=3469 RepID=UPI000E6FED74|nr:aspartic proteinase nepenthesin-2-like [Papaver somniferum]
MGRKDAATLFYMNFVTTVVYLSILLNSSIAVKPRGFSLKMIRSDSQESPLYRGDHLTEAERLERLVRQSKARAHYYGSKTSSHNKSSMNPDIVRLPVELAHQQQYYYLVEVGIGTFSSQAQAYNDYYLIMDTGSDLTWIQCEGGTSYFYQDAPFFPHQDSSTYDPIPCKDNPGVCDEQHCNDAGYCMYEQGYVSGQTTSGDLAFEKFTTGSSTGEEFLETVELVMGCGFKQKNWGYGLGVPDIGDGHQLPQPLPRRGKALVAGVLGLGQGDFSTLIHQFYYYEGKFAYCLESHASPAVAGSHTYLRFGSDATIGGGPEAVHTTPIYRNPDFGTPYYLHLEDISIGDRRVNFTSRDFEIKPDGKRGTIIDSGAPLSTLSRPHFERVKKVLVEYMEAQGARVDATAATHTHLDPCFDIPPTFDPNKFPTMTFHFQQADYVLDQVSDIFFSNDHDDGSLLCFSILGVDGDPYDFTLGAMQQAHKRILYDVNGKSLLFTKENCQMAS